MDVKPSVCVSVQFRPGLLHDAHHMFMNSNCRAVQPAHWPVGHSLHIVLLSGAELAHMAGDVYHAPNVVLQVCLPEACAADAWR